jgi:hypothetical protein
MKSSVKTISVFVNTVDNQEEPISYRGSAWTVSVEDNGVYIYKNGKAFGFYPTSDVINVVEHG